MTKELDNRLCRLEGQLKKLHQRIAEGDDCADVIPQFLAVKGAFAGAFDLYVKESAAACADTDKEKLEKLLSLLIKS